MSVSTQTVNGNVRLVSVEGRLAQELNPELEATLLDLLQHDHNRLAVDLSETSYINSGGLRTLVTAWRQARQGGGNLVLFGLSHQVREIFEIVGFDRVFEIYPSLDAATAALVADR